MLRQPLLTGCAVGPLVGKSMMAGTSVIAAGLRSDETVPPGLLSVLAVLRQAGALVDVRAVTLVCEQFGQQLLRVRDLKQCRTMSCSAH